MTTNLLGLTATVCVVAAVGGLAGPLWALLLLGVFLAAMTWVSHTQDDVAAQVGRAVEARVSQLAGSAERDKALALAEAADRAARQLDAAVAAERARWMHADAAGIAEPPPYNPDLSLIAEIELGLAGAR